MRSYLTRKESIVISALDIINEYGINEVSLRGIASKEGISEAALYKHFKSKEEILMAILEYYSRYDSNIMDTIKKSSMNPKEAIIFFMRSLIESTEGHPAMTCIVNYFELLTNESSVVKKTKDIFLCRVNFLADLIQAGQREGIIDARFSHEDLAEIIIGIERILTLKWRMTNYSFPLKDKVLTTLEKQLQA